MVLQPIHVKKSKKNAAINVVEMAAFLNIVIKRWYQMVVADSR